MIEKSIYEDYEIDFKYNYDTDKKAYYLIFNNKRQILLDKDNSIKNVELDENNTYDFKLYIGKYKQIECFVLNTDSEEGNFKNILDVYNLDESLYLLLTRAVLVRDWYITNKYCGRCASQNVIDDVDMMLKCPECGQHHYSRIAPAIIVAITKDDRLLMAKHSYHKIIKYALIAGFVEAGESIEEAVHREVKEEVGINIKNLEYKRSQSWPFPNSLMLGFTAEYESGNISVDETEIVHAKWFRKDEIEKYPSDVSISAWLVDDFIENH